MNNPVNQPAHYTAGSIEPIETQAMNFNIDCAVKYLSRYKHKGSALTDLLKALRYIEREITALEKCAPEAHRAHFPGAAAQPPAPKASTFIPDVTHAPPQSLPHFDSAVVEYESFPERT